MGSAKFTFFTAEVPKNANFIKSFLCHLNEMACFFYKNSNFLFYIKRNFETFSRLSQESKNESKFLHEGF